MSNISELELRHTDLFKIGMARTQDGFVFQGITLSLKTVEKLNSKEWTETLEQVKFSIFNKKHKIEMEVKTDKQKLLDFVKSLEQVTGPELKDTKSNHILDGALHLIKCARDYVKEQVELKFDFDEK